MKTLVRPSADRCSEKYLSVVNFSSGRNWRLVCPLRVFLPAIRFQARALRFRCVNRSLSFQRPVNAVLVVVALECRSLQLQIRPRPELRLVQTLPSNRSDQSLDKWMGPWNMGNRFYFRCSEDGEICLALLHFDHCSDQVCRWALWSRLGQVLWRKQQTILRLYQSPMEIQERRWLKKRWPPGQGDSAFSQGNRNRRSADPKFEGSVLVGADGSKSITEVWSERTPQRQRADLRAEEAGIPS